MAPSPSARSHVPPFYVMDVLAAAHERMRTHGDTLYLCAGQPSTAAPRRVLDAAAAGVRDSLLGYTEALGIPELRRAIAGHHTATTGASTSTDDVIITTGSSGGFTLLFLAALDAGDDVVLARPGYPAYRNALQALGANVVEVDCGADTRFQLTAAKLDDVTAARGRTPGAVIVTSPDNPTGTIIDPGELRNIAQWCERHGCLLISDEIYHGITYGRPCASARAYSDAAVVVGSVSKYFSMTGWRIGWLIVPGWLKDPLDRLAANMTVCPPAVSQAAAVEAFHPDSIAELDGHVRRYADNRALLLERLPQVGLTSIAPPDGGFYVYADVSHLTEDSLAWSRDLLKATGVAVAPGIDFDPVAGAGWVRLCFAGTTADVAAACDRIGGYTGA